MKIDELTNTALRSAIWKNQVSFPAQVPIFHKQTRPDLQWRLVELFFIHGWSFRKLGKRYSLTPQRIIQIVNAWKIRAISLGLVQDIPAEPGISEARSNWRIDEQYTGGIYGERAPGIGQAPSGP